MLNRHYQPDFDEVTPEFERRAKKRDTQRVCVREARRAKQQQRFVYLPEFYNA